MICSHVLHQRCGVRLFPPCGAMRGHSRNALTMSPARRLLIPRATTRTAPAWLLTHQPVRLYTPATRRLSRHPALYHCRAPLLTALPSVRSTRQHPRARRRHLRALIHPPPRPPRLLQLPPPEARPCTALQVRDEADVSAVATATVAATLAPVDQSLDRRAWFLRLGFPKTPLRLLCRPCFSRGAAFHRRDQQTLYG